MSKLNIDIDWSWFITVDEGVFVDVLNSFSIDSKNNIKVSIYTVKYKGREYNTDRFINVVKKSITNYVLSKSQIRADERNKIDSLQTAMVYFGKIPPDKDGKIGELILYLLVESILKVPLLAFKMTSSMKDQAKGADGLFCGIYKNKNAILLGESKVWEDFGTALTDAFKSVNRFHGKDKKEFLEQEYLVASGSNRYYQFALTQDQIDHIFDCLISMRKGDGGIDIVHPILIIYEKSAISKLEGSNEDELEMELSKLLKNEVESHISKIDFRLEKDDFKELNSIDLEFFMIPVDSVKNFRNDIFLSFHGKTWDDYNKEFVETNEE